MALLICMLCAVFLLQPGHVKAQEAAAPEEITEETVETEAAETADTEVVEAAEVVEEAAVAEEAAAPAETAEEATEAEAAEEVAQETDTAVPEEETAEEETTEPFIERLREAMDARYDTDFSEEELHAPFRAEMELMEEFRGMEFEDAKLGQLAELYFAAADGILRSENFEQQEEVFELLEETAIEQYAVAILCLNEQYGLPLDEEEIETYQDISGISLGTAAEGTDKTAAKEDDEDESERVTIGSYSYKIPAGFAKDEDLSDEESTFFVNDSEEEMYMIAATSDEEIGEYSFLGPMLLDVIFSSMQEEFGLEDMTIEDAEFDGYTAKRAKGTMEEDGETGYVDVLMTITDKDMIVLMYILRGDSEDAAGLDSFLENIVPAEDIDEPEISGEPEDEPEKLDGDPIITSDNGEASESDITLPDTLEFVAEYTLQGYNLSHYIVVKNISDQQLALRSETTAYNADGEVEDFKNGYIDVLAPGQEYLFSEYYDSDLEPVRFETDIKAEESDYYASGYDDLEIEMTTTKKGAVVTLTNISDTDVVYPYGTVIFLKDGEVVACNGTYVCDGDRIAAGESATKQINAYTDFDEALLYIKCRK